MYGESKMTFIFSKEEEVKLETTLEMLREIRRVLSKYGSFVDTEITQVKDAEDVVDRILKGDMF